MTRSPTRVIAGFYLAVALAATYILLGSPLAIDGIGWADAPLIVLIALHYVWGIVLVFSSSGSLPFRRSFVRRLVFVPEVLGAFALLLFLFSYIFALNANMDYVQRFIAAGGNLRLALDTRVERLLVWARVFPLVALNLGVYLLVRVSRYRAVREACRPSHEPRDAIVRPWSLVLVLLSSFLITIAQPSFVSLDGIAMLGWIGFVPLFLVLRSVRFGHGVFYGIVFGVFSTLLTSYWLGTFNLVSLAITVLFFLIYYALFTPVALLAYRLVGRARPLVFPLAFLVLEYLRSIGFLGYPWALAAHTQYAVLPLIQIAALTGVWGVSFVVLLANSAIAEFIGAQIDRRRAATGTVRSRFGWLVATAGVVGAVILYGTVVIAVADVSQASGRSVRIAQIQQSNDPRKSDYEQTFATLRRLTDETMASSPDLVTWSETAFVPNIRHWTTNTSVRRFHVLVRSFLDYQRSLGTWLLTGNDDYEVELDERGAEADRTNYNSTVLFDDRGVRRATYRKIRLVPFTEHFPYRDQLPWVYDLLKEFDVYFWGQGTEMTVFEHPLVRFSTPICYEDVFPNFVRGFVLAGAELLLNVSNDYWSLAEVQAKQHFVAGLFRAVENRRPVVRTTASGLTGSIDPYGRILATIPQFQEATLISDVRIADDQPLTLYTRWGDYFPIATAGVLLVIVTGAGVGRRRRPPTAQAPDASVKAPKRAVPPPPAAAAPATPTAPPKAAVQPTPAAPPKAATIRDGSLREAAKPNAERSRRKKRVNWRAIWDE